MTLFGEAGVGKTTLAALMPAPVFIRTEDGTASLAGADHVALFPIARSTADVEGAFQTLLDEKHDFRTVVLDSVTQLATMIEAEIIAADPKAKSIATAQGGYGAGYKAAAERHRVIRERAGRLLERGMNVVFLAHADTETMDLPDADPYTRYTLRLHKGSVSHYVDNVDLVGLVRLKSYVKQDGGKSRAITDGTREIVCTPQPASVTKNRFGITAPLAFDLTGDNPFAHYLMGGR